MSAPGAGGTSGRFSDVALAGRQHDTIGGSYTHFQAAADGAGALHELFRYGCRAHLARGSIKDLEPAIEVLRIDGQRQMQSHRLSLVSPASRHNSRPEITDARKMRLPVLDTRIEDGTDQRIDTDPGVEGAHQHQDQTIIDHGILSDFKPSRRLGHRSHAPSGKAVMRW